MATTLDKSIKRHADYILEAMGPTETLSRRFNIFLNCAAQQRYTLADLAGTVGCTQVELKDLTADRLLFAVKGKAIALDFFGVFMFSLCLGTSESPPPSGLFTGNEEDLWDEWCERLFETKSAYKSMSIGKLQQELRIVQAKLNCDDEKEEADKILFETLSKALYPGFRSSSIGSIQRLLERYPEFRPYRRVIRKADKAHLYPGPAIIMEPDEFRAIVRRNAAELLEAFDALSLTNTHLIPAFIAIAASAGTAPAISRKIGCGKAEAEASIAELSPLVATSTGKCQLNGPGILLFRKHFQRRENGAFAHDMFVMTDPERMQWIDASENLLASPIGPGGETVEDVMAMPHDKLQPDGVTPYRTLLEPLELKELSWRRTAASIVDVRRLVAAFPHLKPYQKVISWAKAKKLPLCEP